MEFCRESGMIINEKRQLDGCHTCDTVGYSSQYVYLGAHFTDDGRLSTTLKLHMLTPASIM